MIFSIGIGLTAFEINPEAFSKSYYRMRFVKPVHISDTIHSEITIFKKEKPKDPKWALLPSILKSSTKKEKWCQCAIIYY